LGSVIKVENNSSKGFLLKNTEKFQNSSHHENSDKGGSGGINVFKLFRFGGSAKIVQENSNEWEETGKSLNEQVMEFKIYIIFWLKLIFSCYFPNFSTVKEISQVSHIGTKQNIPQKTVGFIP